MSKIKFSNNRRSRGKRGGTLVETPSTESIVSMVPELRQKYLISQEQMARLMGASWPTISRWERAVTNPNPEHLEKLKRLKILITRIEDALPASEFMHFLTTPHPLLRGYPPMDMLNSGYSFEDLLTFVEAAKSGDMA